MNYSDAYTPFTEIMKNASQNNPTPSASATGKSSALTSIGRFILTFLAAYFLTRLFIRLVQRLKFYLAKRGGQAPGELLERQGRRESILKPVEIVLERAAERPHEPVTQVERSTETASEALREAETSDEALPEIEADPGISFGLALGEAGAESIPDPYFTVPSDLLVDSFDPQYQFNWQNPHLIEDIYPHRKEKLVDYLAFYTEIDLYEEYRTKGSADPAIVNKIQAAKKELRQARQAVKGKLEKAIQDKKEGDKYFASITGRDDKNLRFKQKYYLDREIQRHQEKFDHLVDRKNTLLKRVDWYSPEDERRELWRQRAEELNPEIEEVERQLGAARAIRELLEREAELPQDEIQSPSIEDLTRWELREKRARWESMSQEQLLEEIITDWLQRTPDRFPEWLIYMLIHFSGMRYKSSHGSWAEPRFLLELLMREDIEDQISQLEPAQLDAACSRVVREIQRVAETTPKALEVKSNPRLIKRLQTAGVQERALLEYRTAEALEEIQKLPDDDACLDRLVQYKVEKDSRGDPVPEWVWAEIVKYTPLRLGTEDPDWESTSAERWKYTNHRWREILSTWKGKDITGWRQKHRQSLDLIVTRAVCNEIAEHIQHLRGLTPAAGLAAKPYWYLRQASNHSGQAYFKQAPSQEDFKTGASILWLDWVDRQPNAWQIAHPLPGFDFFSGGARPSRSGGSGNGWETRPSNGSFIRTRRKPSRKELKAQGKSRQEIQKIMAERRQRGNIIKQYLRWTHEATVVDVVDMIDGKYVLTFETGKIGLILRRLGDLVGDPMVFVGYVPGIPDLPPELDRKLVDMLRWDRILPQTSLPERVRPRKGSPL